MVNGNLGRVRAEKMLNDGKTIKICLNKENPQSPWGLGLVVTKEFLEISKITFKEIVEEYVFHNSMYTKELGTYARFYLVER